MRVLKTRQERKDIAKTAKKLAIRSDGAMHVFPTHFDAIVAYRVAVWPVEVGVGRKQNFPESHPIRESNFHRHRRGAEAHVREEPL